MSGVYLYGITDGHRPRLPDGVGLLRVDGIGGVYGPAPEEEARPTEDALWAHERVVEALMDDGAVLPARFGTVVADLERLEEELLRRKAEFARALERVRGRVELGVRAAWIGQRPAGGRAASGRDYLEHKLELQQATASLHEPLARLAVESTVRVLPGPDLTLVAAYLVDREAVAPFREEAERLARTLEGVRLACTGPWPPYNFTAGEDAS